MSTTRNPPVVIIVGAGVSGLLLAQYLRKTRVSFRIFERDTDLTTRGVGWGLTLHWSLPALRTLLPQELVDRLPEAYVDRGAVERGEQSAFPYYDLTTGKLRTASPKASESQRIRVTRQGLRDVLATGLEIEWGKAFREYKSNEASVTVTFDDGSSCAGSVLVACDGVSSRVRRQLFPFQDKTSNYQLPIALLGLRVDYTPEQCRAMREFDAYFLHATASASNIFTYFSVLDAPGNRDDGRDKYSYQVVVSWPQQEGFFGKSSPIKVPTAREAKMGLMRTFAETWSEPFRSFVLSIPEESEITALKLSDWLPPKGLRSTGRVVLMGDSFHTMTMYRGEGANHAIVDVLDFAEQLGPQLQQLVTSDTISHNNLRAALDKYEDLVVDRSRPAVLASRKACIDAHDWSKTSGDSPLLSRRAMMLDFKDEDF